MADHLVDKKTGKILFITAVPVVSKDKSSLLYQARNQLLDKVLLWSTSTSNTTTFNEKKQQDAGETQSKEDVVAARTSYLSEQIDAFFENTLARAIQERESNYINMMSECYQLQVQSKDEYIQEQQRRLELLEEKSKTFDREVEILRSRLDRRAAENDALRKDFYKQLLMLREIVNKQKADPRTTAKMLDDVITSVAFATSKRDTEPDVSVSTSSTSSYGLKSKSAPLSPGGGGVGSLRKEKEKWEQRAKETQATCTALQVQIRAMRQELDELRNEENEMWFANGQSGAFERQKVLDAVHRSRYSWEDVGDAILELLNNDYIWEAIEGRAREGKSRASRGLEALFLRASQINNDDQQMYSTQMLQHQQIGMNSTNSTEQTPGSKPPMLQRKKSMRQANNQGGNMVACHTCHGMGLIDAAFTSSVQENNESYLRKTLAQVLELQNTLRENEARTNLYKEKFQDIMEKYKKISDQMESIEKKRLEGIEQSVQVDMDTEVDLNEIVESFSDSNSRETLFEANDGTIEEQRERIWRRKSRRNTQYDHLIVELKHELSKSESTIASMRLMLEDTQERLVQSQKISFEELKAAKKEIQALKASLVLSIKHRNSDTEEKRAAVKFLVKRTLNKSTAISTSVDTADTDTTANSYGKATDTANVTTDASPNETATEEVAKNVEETATASDPTNTVPPGALENDESTNSCAINKEGGELLEDELKRAEERAQQYTEAVERVQKEYEEQKAALEAVEANATAEEEQKKKSNAIALGNILITMASHPKDVFKALGVAQNEIMQLKKASIHNSTIQADRIVALTTRLSKLSEEMVTVIKRTITEVDYWKLECKKRQNATKTVTAELQEARQRIQRLIDTRNRQMSVPAAGCNLCQRHQTRMNNISNDITYLSKRYNAAQNGTGDQAQLFDVEQKQLATIMTELEGLFVALSKPKRHHAKVLLTDFFLPRPEDIEIRVAGDTTHDSHGTSSTEESVGDSKPSPNSKKSSTHLVNGSPRNKSRTSSKRNLETSSKPMASASQQELEQETTSTIDTEIKALLKINDPTNMVEPGSQREENISTTHGVASFLTTEAAQMHLTTERGDASLIQDLRVLLKYNDKMKELLALVHWKVLLCNLRAKRDQVRLDEVNDKCQGHQVKNRDLGATEPAPRYNFSIRNTMLKLIFYREMQIEALVTGKEKLKKDQKILHSEIAHTISRILQSLGCRTEFQALIRQVESKERPQSSRLSKLLETLDDVVGVPLQFPFSTADNRRPYRIKYAMDTSSPRPNTAKDTSVSSLDSPFEKQNRFPLRMTKFLGAEEGVFDFSLTHATSEIKPFSCGNHVITVPNSNKLPSSLFGLGTNYSPSKNPKAELAFSLQQLLRPQTASQEKESPSNTSVKPARPSTATKARFSPRPHSSPGLSRGQKSKDASAPFSFLAAESAVLSERKKVVEEISSTNAVIDAQVTAEVEEFDMRFAP